MENIGKYLQEAVAKTDVVNAIASGTLELSNYVRYMADVYCYALHSSQVIAVAGSRLVLSHPELADYLFEHAREELGHDKWAKQDLMELGVKPDQVRKLVPSERCQKMIALEYFYSHHANAVGLFGWMLALEGLGGAIGGSIAKGIDTCLNLEGKGTYFLSGHGEADHHHSAELIGITKKYITCPDEVELVRRVGQMSQNSYVGILDDCVRPEMFV